MPKLFLKKMCPLGIIKYRNKANNGTALAEEIPNPKFPIK